MNEKVKSYFNPFLVFAIDHCTLHQFMNSEAYRSSALTYSFNAMADLLSKNRSYSENIPQMKQYIKGICEHARKFAPESLELAEKALGIVESLKEEIELEGLEEWRGYCVKQASPNKRCEEMREKLEKIREQLGQFEKGYLELNKILQELKRMPEFSYLRGRRTFTN